MASVRLSVPSRKVWKADTGPCKAGAKAYTESRALLRFLPLSWANEARFSRPLVVASTTESTALGAFFLTASTSCCTEETAAL